MTQQGRNLAFQNISSRLRYPSQIEFSTSFYDVEKYYLLVLDEDDIFFTSPALFLWLDTGLQKLKSASTSKEHIKIIKSEVLEIPKRDFKKITENFTDVCCLINFAFNPNLSNSNELREIMVELEGLKTKASSFFTGALWEKNTIL